MVRHNSVAEGCRVPDGSFILSTSNIHSDKKLARIEPVNPDVSGFPESVAQVNHERVKGYKRIRNGF